VLERGDVKRGNKGSDIFNLESRLGGDTIVGQVFINRGPQECAVD
jgi:hypothetical protein